MYLNMFTNFQDCAAAFELMEGMSIGRSTDWRGVEAYRAQAKDWLDRGISCSLIGPIPGGFCGRRYYVDLDGTFIFDAFYARGDISPEKVVRQAADLGFKLRGVLSPPEKP